MEKRDDYEPIIIDLQKSQAIYQPKLYFFVFVGSVAMLGVLVLFAAFYFRQPSPNGPVSETPVIVVSTPIPRRSTPVPAATNPVVTEQPPIQVTEEKGWLNLSSSPANAEVAVDGIVLGYTPLENYELAAGVYTVNFSYEGVVSQQQITVRPGETTEFQHVFPGFGSLQIDTTRSGCDITVNGKSIGKSPVLLEGLSSGPYTIIARKIGYASVEKVVTLKKGEHRELFMTIRSLDSVSDSSSKTTPTPDGPVHPSDRRRQNTP